MSLEAWPQADRNRPLGWQVLPLGPSLGQGGAPQGTRSCRGIPFLSPSLRAQNLTHCNACHTESHSFIPFPFFPKSFTLFFNFFVGKGIICLCSILELIRLPHWLHEAPFPSVEWSSFSGVFSGSSAWAVAAPCSLCPGPHSSLHSVHSRGFLPLLPRVNSPGHSWGKTRCVRGDLPKIAWSVFISLSRFIACLGLLVNFQNPISSEFVWGPEAPTLKGTETSLSYV